MRQLLLLLIVLLAVPALAQDVPTVTSISYGSTVEDTITEAAIFDWWQVQAAEGDQLAIEMAASGGLEPLVAVLSPGGDVVARSNDGSAGATVSLNYTAQASALYTIVATRVGGADGTSTGTYTLRLRRGNPAPRPDTYQDVTFRCHDFEATTAATISFAEDAKTDLRHRVTVYGMDGFKPVIRLTFSASDTFSDCNVDAEHTTDDTFTLPGEPPRTITADTRDNASQLIISGAENMRLITLTIASRDGQPGRYVAVIEGFTLERGDRDAVEVRVGPLAAETTALTVYMVGTASSRLDPLIYLPASDQSCDDAGRRGCEDVPSFTGAGFTLHESGGTTITGDRNDAGIMLAPGNPDPITLELGSRNGETYGDYALVLIGELPLSEG
ncbi:MAG: hypothetical protein HZC41_05705 [Chloroflexi bacterium]|nr:hypothetical protein [Chloroflexota bacterium]